MRLRIQKVRMTRYGFVKLQLNQLQASIIKYT